MMRARLGIDKTKSWADWAEEEEIFDAEDAVDPDRILPPGTTEDAKADAKPKCEPTLQLGMRLRGGGSEGCGDSGHASGEGSGDEGEESGGEGGDQSADEDASDVDSSGNVEGLINDIEEDEAEAEEEDNDDEEEEESMEEEAAEEEELDPSGILPTGTARVGRKPDWYRDKNHATRMLADVPAHEREVTIHGSHSARMVCTL